MSVDCFEECAESEATHVEILDDEYEHNQMCSVLVGKVYEILRNDEKDFEGEEMILCEDGVYLCSFSLVLNIKWLKKKKEAREL